MAAEFAALAWQGVRGFGEPPQLLVGRGELRIVRAREVGEEIDRRFDARQSAQAAARRFELIALEAEPIHAAIELEPHPEGLARSGFAQQFDLFPRVHHELEARFRGRIELCSVEDALEQHGALLDPGAAQREPFIDPRHRERIRGLERARDRHQPVAVGVRLDHRHDLGARRPIAYALQVVSEGADIDGRADHRGHARLTEIRPRRTTQARSSRTWCTGRGT
jgi:hypothetical protein